ncbi:MAG: hypothetical protein ACLTSD_11350 [Eubacterium sp.]
MKKKIGMVVFVLIIINVLAVILLMMHKETTKVEKPDTASKQEMVKNEGKACKPLSAASITGYSK